MPRVLSLPREALRPLLLYLPPTRVEWSSGRGSTESVTTLLESVESHCPACRTRIHLQRAVRGLARGPEVCTCRLGRPGDDSGTLPRSTALVVAPADRSSCTPDFLSSFQKEDHLGFSPPPPQSSARFSALISSPVCHPFALPAGSCG